MRCAAIMLDAKCRGSVPGIVSTKKDQSNSNIMRDPVKNFFCQATIDFRNPECLVPQPKEEHLSEFPNEDLAMWDHDNHAVLEHDHDGKWTMETWFQHVEPKHQQSLNK